MTSVAVVIPTWNGAGLLPSCLDALAAQTRTPDHVVVVDNGSEDGSPALLSRSYPGVEVVRFDRNRGFAAAVNAGIRATDTELVALLNNDAVPDPSWLDGLVTALGGDRVGMVASKIVAADDPRVLEGIGLEVDRDGNPSQIGDGERDGPRFATPREVFGPIAAAALYRRRLLDEVGTFDEKFFAYLEDVDLAWRARRSGWSCRYTPDAVVTHRRASTGRRIPRRIRYLGRRNHVWLMVKNADALTLARFVLRQPLRDAVEVLRLLVRGRLVDAGLLIAARAAGIAGVPRMLYRRVTAATPTIAVRGTP